MPLRVKCVTGVKGVDAALVEHGEEERLNGVVAVMAEGELVGADLEAEVHQRAAAHLRAQGAGVFLLALLEDDLADLRFADDIGNVQRFAERAHAAEVEGLKAHGEGHGGERVRIFREAAVERERVEQQQTVLAPGDADGDVVARGDHAEILVGAAQTAEYFFHVRPPNVFAKRAPFFAAHFRVLLFIRAKPPWPPRRAPAANICPRWW